ncbi:unnamed protein product [Meganyctiphanes norvegica]|uniref:C2H2-type domain-containing protein n=1 Tax=Meganyctiphanes norvegica TaxID=48144 RepID=A0AAV2R9I1_MEGNR
MTEPSDYYVPNGGWYVSQDQRNWILGFLDGGKKKTDNSSNYQNTFSPSNSVASPPPQQYNYQPSSVASSVANIQQGLYQNSVINSVGNLQQSQFQNSSSNSTSNLHQGQYQNLFGNAATNLLANTATNILANSATNLLANSTSNLLANSATNILFGQQSTSQPVSNFPEVTIQPTNSGNFRTSSTFECRQCYAKFSSSRDLQYHMLRHAGGPENVQPEIQIQSPDFIQQRQVNSIDFSQQQQSPQQQAGPTPWGLYNCPQCLLKFNSSRDLQYHMVYQCGTSNSTINQQHQVQQPKPSPTKSQAQTQSSMYQYPVAARVKGPYPDHVIVCACVKGEKLFNPCRAHKHLHVRLTKLEEFTGYKAFEESKNIYYLSEPDIKQEPGVKLFECGICNLSFVNREGLLEHMPTHEGVKYMLMHEADDTFECPQCFLRFKSSKDLHYHIMEHQGKKFFDCLQCGTKFTANWSLQQHIKVVHYKERDFICPICHRRFAIMSTLKNHMLVHTQEKPYKCSQCDYCCNQRGTLKVHVRRHHTYEKPFKCEKCLKHFTTRYCLNQHDEKIHRDKESLRCSLCEYKCKDGVQLKKHLKCHIETPYRCKYCSRRFRDHDVFKDHISDHKGKNAYQCKFCRFNTKHNQSLRNHMGTHHPGQMPYNCNVCEKKFLISTQLKRHMLLHTSDETYDCPKCEYQCRLWITLRSHFVKKHVNVESLQCGICEVKFETLDEVNEHIVDHAEKKPFSKERDPTFRPKGRQKRRYRCQICNKKFKKKLSFQRHWRAHDVDDIEDIEPLVKTRSKSKRIMAKVEKEERENDIITLEENDIVGGGDDFVVKPEEDDDYLPSGHSEIREEDLEDYVPLPRLRLPKNQRPCPKSKKIQRDRVRRPPPIRRAPRTRAPHMPIPEDMYPVFVPRKPKEERKPHMVEQKPQMLEPKPQNLVQDLQKPQNLVLELHKPQNLVQELHKPQNLVQEVTQAEYHHVPAVPASVIHPLAAAVPTTNYIHAAHAAHAPINTTQGHGLVFNMDHVHNPGLPTYH